MAGSLGISERRSDRCSCGEQARLRTIDSSFPDDQRVDFGIVAMVDLLESVFQLAGVRRTARFHNQSAVFDLEWNIFIVGGRAAGSREDIELFEHRAFQTGILGVIPVCHL